MPEDTDLPPARPESESEPRGADGAAGAAGAAPHGLTSAALALERHVITSAHAVHNRDESGPPAWLRRTRGEHPWHMAFAVVMAIALQVSLPASLTTAPHFALPILEGAVLVTLLAANPGRLVRHSSGRRVAALVMTALVSANNAISAVLLVRQIVDGTGTPGSRLLLEGADIWLTNVIVFALWYWEFDRGGPARRTHGERRYPDLLFPQMQQTDIATPDWEPNFFDYLYTSFTNGTAFSPTDTMPLSRWVKGMFLLQSMISLITVALVISRAVNIFRGPS